MQSYSLILESIYSSFTGWQERNRELSFNRDYKPDKISLETTTVTEIYKKEVYHGSLCRLWLNNTFFKNMYVDKFQCEYGKGEGHSIEVSVFLPQIHQGSGIWRLLCKNSIVNEATDQCTKQCDIWWV